MKRIALTTILIAMLCLTASADASLLFFDDFESGDFSKWTLTTISNVSFFSDTPSANGASNESVGYFDTNNDGVATLSARFQVGKIAVENSSQMAGVLLTRQVQTTASTRLHASADVAVQYPFITLVGDPGRFDMYFDSPVVRDSVDFGDGGLLGLGGTSLHDNLDLTTGLFVNPGIFNFNIRITRFDLVGDNALFQFLDNVSVEALDILDEPSVSPIPEPATLVLLGVGFAGACLRKKIRI